jgi:hypothetical protein
VHRRRYSSSAIFVAPMGVTDKRGEDHAVNKSQGRKEGGGTEDNNVNDYHDGGEEAGALQSNCHCPLLF